MCARCGRWWAAAAGSLVLGLGCGGSPADGVQPEAGRGEVRQIDTPQGGTTVWARQLGGAGSEIVVDVAPAPDGGAALVTMIGRTGPFNHYPTSMGLVRLRADGTVAWSREFALGGAPAVCSAAVTGMGNVFLSASVRCQGTGCLDLGGGHAVGALVAKYAPDGRFVWQRAVGGLNGAPVAVDAAGSAAVAVSREGTGATAGARLVKLRWDGATLWDLPAPAVNPGVSPAPSALAFDPAGNLAVGDGLAFYSLDPAGKVRWTAHLADPAVPGYVAEIGATSLGTVVAIARSGGDGTLSWAGATSSVAGGGLLAVAEANGAPRFGRALEAPPATPIGGAVDPAGRVAILYSMSGGWGIQKWNLDGVRLWMRRFPSQQSGSLSLLGLAIDPVSHHVRAAGFFTGTIDVGTGPLSSRGDNDDLVLDLMP